MRSVRSAFLRRASSSSRGRVVYRAVKQRLPFFSADECSADRRIQGDAGLSYFRAEFRF